MRPLPLRLPFVLLALAILPRPVACAAAPNALAEAIVLAPQGGAAPEDVAIAQWQERARSANATREAFTRLGWAYIAKARRTLDAGYYKLAEETADAIDARFGPDADSQLLRGHVCHNLHRFHEAEAIARHLTATRGDPEDYALLSDALMEQGRLAESVAALQRMVDLRPGAEAYSRIAHLRWLEGDLRGATAAMIEAERATGPNEAGAWTRVRLALYCLQAGATARSLTLAESALHEVPAYPPALLARGRALLALGRTAEAIPALQRAAQLNPLPEYQWWLADALRAIGRRDEAIAVEKQIETRGARSDPRTLALFLATRHAAPAEAVQLARDELATRRDVFTHDALAWALLANGDATAAETEMQRALAAHTADARLFWHAGQIALACGHPAQARDYFARARPLAGTLTPGERTSLLARTDALAALIAATPSFSPSK